MRTPRPALDLPVLIPMLSLLACCIVGTSQAQPTPDDPHAGHGHTQPMHLLHPLITESPLPENEARLSLITDELADGGSTMTLQGTVEHAPVRWFSLELAAPITFLDDNAGSDQFGLGNIVVGAKFASFALEEHGVLLATGLEIELPTGDEEEGIGTDDSFEIAPWVGGGFKHGRIESITRVEFAFPTNQNDDNEADVEIEWATSLLYHVVDDRLAALVELDGTSIFGEAEDGFNNISITPGLRLYPFENPDVALGVGVRLPLTDDRESDVQGIFTLYFHF